MKRKDFLFIVIFIVIVAFSFTYLFQSSYAKYKRQSRVNLEGNIASWNIKINNESINNQATLTNSITPTIVHNDYVKDGTIAPGSTGYFTITIDATDVDVDFLYDIYGEVDNTTPLLDLKITDYKIGNGSTTQYNSSNHITGEIQKNTSSTEITIYFEWDDSNTSQMNNQQDTEYALTQAYENTKILVTLQFTQKRQS